MINYEDGRTLLNDYAYTTNNADDLKDRTYFSAMGEKSYIGILLSEKLEVCGSGPYDDNWDMDDYFLITVTPVDLSV
jgi:hypothetical protein